MDEQPDLTPTPSRRIDADLACVSCGYSLLGLTEDASCPECGVAIARTLAGDWLRNSPQRHRQRIARGAALVTWGMAMAFMLPVGILIIGLTLPIVVAVGGGELEDGLVKAGFVLAGLSVVAGLVCLVWGWVWLTASDPSRLEPGPIERSARRARWSLVAVGLWAAFGALGASLATGRVGLLGDLALRGLPFAFLAVHGWLVMDYAAVLAARVPAGRLQRHARASRWGVAVWCGAGWLLCGLGPIVAGVIYWVRLQELWAELRRLALLPDPDAAGAASLAAAPAMERA